MFCSCRPLAEVNRVVVLLIAGISVGPVDSHLAFGQSKSPKAAKPVKAEKAPRIPPPRVGSQLKLSAALQKAAPESVDDLATIENHVAALVPKLTAATVGVIVGRVQASGVIVSKDGYVLTAAHVTMSSGQKVAVILPNGKRVSGISLGLNRGTDAGLIKITSKGDYPFVPIGDTNQTNLGDWCIATGHPDGFRPGRTPVVRLGRLIDANSAVIQSDAVFVEGDDGGGLFDMHGRVIGIHSRIGRPVTYNFHVPISEFSKNWHRLTQSEVWGRNGRRVRNGGVIGVNGENHKQGCRLTAVPDGFPAKKAGLKVGDIITKFDGKKVAGFSSLVQFVAVRMPGDKVQLEAVRDGKTMKFTVTLAKR